MSKKREVLALLDELEHAVERGDDVRDLVKRLRVAAEHELIVASLDIRRPLYSIVPVVPGEQRLAERYETVKTRTTLILRNASAEYTVMTSEPLTYSPVIAEVQE